MPISSRSPASLSSGARRLATLFIVSCAAAQQPSAWTDLTPPGGANAAKFSVLGASSVPGKLVMYRDAQYLRVFSTVTGRWHAHPLSFGTTPRLFAEVLLVPEFDRWTAFSAYRGVFETLMINFSASTMTAGNSIASVRLGNDVHLFSAFTGRWHTRTIPADWNQVLSDRIATFKAPGFNTFGGFVLFDALRGDWHELPAQNVSLAQASTSASTAMWLFRRADQSTYQATWSTHWPSWQFHQIAAVPPLHNLGGGGTAGSEFVAIWDLAFSGLTRALTSLGRTLAPTTAGLVSVAYDTDAMQYYCLGIGGATWVTMPAGLLPVNSFPQQAAAVRLFGIGNQTYAFNGLTNTIASVTNERGALPYGGLEGNLVGAVADVNTGRVDVYSVATGRWHPVPANVLPEVATAPYRPQPKGTSTSVLLATDTGVVAFSGRTGAFVPLNRPGLTRHLGGVVSDGANVHVFDARTDRWLSAPVTFSPTPSDYQFDGSVVVADANRAVGFGARSSRLESLQLPEPALAYGAIDGGGWVRTANHIYGFAGLPEDMSLQGFPEDMLVCGPGMTFRHQLRLPAGGVGAMFLSPRPAGPISLPPFGELWVDLTRALLLGTATVAPGELRAEFALSVPDLPQLRGTEWFLQSLIVPAAAAPYLTDPTNLFLQ